VPTLSTAASAQVAWGSRLAVAAATQQYDHMLNHLQGTHR